jgi:hypothetical protein
MIDVVVFGDEPIIEFPAEGFASSVPVTCVGPNLLRLEGVPLVPDLGATFGDVIEVSPISRDRFRFERVAEPGGWSTYLYSFSREHFESLEGRLLFAFLDVIEVHWERIFGGILLICVPPELAFFTPHRWVCATLRSGRFARRARR